MAISVFAGCGSANTENNRYPGVIDKLAVCKALVIEKELDNFLFAGQN